MSFFATADFLLLVIGLMPGFILGYIFGGARANQRVREQQLVLKQRQEIIDELRWQRVNPESATPPVGPA